MRDDRETRDRLMAAAARLFAAHGYKKVTVREICRAARANVAAVNYHFGGKLGLYRTVLQQAIDAMVRMNEAVRAAGEGRPPEEKLRRFIVILLNQILQPEHSMLHHLVQRERMSLLSARALVDQGIRPRLEYIAGVVAEMIGSDPRDDRVLRCVGSINAQAILYMPSPIATRLGFSFKGTPEDIEAAAAHIAAVSIAGVHALGRPVRSRR
jgi:AcrR family transcriptional regulator